MLYKRVDAEVVSIFVLMPLFYKDNITAQSSNAQ